MAFVAPVVLLVILAEVCWGRTATLTLSSTATASVTTSLSSTPSLTSTATVTTSLSLSLSPSLTETLTLTSTMTPTKTTTQTATTSLQPHSNYTTALEPYTFVAGQEVRVMLQAYYLPPSNSSSSPEPRPHFNVSHVGDLEVRGYKYSSSHDTNCAQYTSSDTPLWTESTFGMTTEDYLLGERFVTTAHSTFTAPTEEFVICFRHTPTGDVFFEHAGIWVLFTSDGYYPNTGPGPSGRWRFKAEQSETWFYLPSPATHGQYAIIEVNSNEVGWNFTSHSCDGPSSCASGDSLKIVPKGTPCTFEHQSYEAGGYLGSSVVSAEGVWEGDAVLGLTEGATAGGAAMFGGRGLNPLVDPPGTVSETVGDQGFPVPPSARAAYAYVRLPPSPGVYEICFSAREQRQAWLGMNTTIDSIPMWRKLWPCAGPRCTQRSGSAFTASSTEASFTVTSEVIGWSMRDKMAGSWGPIRIDAGGSSTLSRAPHTTREELLSDQERYWLARGGDALRVVPARLFSETRSSRRGTVHGSFAAAGCWYRSGDVMFEATSPSELLSATRDLRDDPTDTVPLARSHDQAGVSATFAIIAVPFEPSFVCYRTPAVGRSPTGGWRVLRASASSPGAWVRGATPLLVPDARDGLNETVEWSANDTREGTWGAVRVGSANSTATFDTSPWSWAGDKGTALRLVPAGRPCEWGGWSGAQSLDGGGRECYPLSPCLGSAQDGEAREVSFYIRFPPKGAYTVCLRRGGLNWEALAAPLIVAGPSQITLTADEDRAGRDAVFMVTDDSGGLSTTDIFRMVPLPQQCDVIPSQWSPSLADLHLSPTCLIPDASGVATDAICRTALPFPGMPHPFDDISPRGDTVYNLRTTAAAVTLPAPGTYRLCYKPLTTTENWVVLNDSYVVQASEPSVVSDDAGPIGVVLGGGYQRYTARYVDKVSLFTNQAWFPGSSRTIAEGSAVQLRDGMTTPKLGWPPGSSSTSNPKAAVGAVLRVETTAAYVDFPGFPNFKAHLDDLELAPASSLPPNSTSPTLIPYFAAKIVAFPPENGCLDPPAGTEAGMLSFTDVSWTGGTTRDIAFHLVAPDRPGAYLLCLKNDMRLAWERIGPLSVLDSGARWWTPDVIVNSGTVNIYLVGRTYLPSDTVKVVPAAVPCHSLNDPSAPPSTHIDPIPPLFDGTTFSLMFPAPPGDTRRTYKVCVNTTFDQLPVSTPALRLRWVEVPEASSPVVRDELGRAVHLTTRPSNVKGWHLSPTFSLGREAGGVVVPAGASSRFLAASPTEALSVQFAFPLNTTTIEAKVVLHRTRTVSGWRVVATGRNCKGPASPGAIAAIPALDNAARMNLTVTFPPDQGLYLLCLRRSTEDTWIRLRDATEQAVSSFVTGTTLLSFVAPGQPTAASPATNLTIIDARTDPSSPTSPAGTWCSAGGPIPCSLGFTSDLLYVASETTLCPLPSPPSGGPGWYPLRIVTNSTTAIDGVGTFSLPPLGSAVGERFKLCLFKAGGLGIRPSGLSYQLHNGGSIATGGGTGYFQAADVTVDGLDVQVVAPEYNTSQHYVVARPGEEGKEQLALRSGMELEIIVRPTVRGSIVPYGNYPVWALLCPIGSSATDSMGCVRPVDPGPFVVEETKGACSPLNASRYGWPSHGLRQLLVGGVVKFHVRYLSACPATGCGLRFLALPPGHTPGNPGAPRHEVISHSVWVTVQQHFPDAIQVDDYPVVPRVVSNACTHTSFECPVRTIKHARETAIHLFARYRGPREYAPLGNVTVMWSAADYSIGNSTSAPAEVSSKLQSPLPLPSSSPWGAGGAFHLVLRPMLKPTIDTTTLFLNITVGTGVWTRLLVEVTRPLPKAAYIASLRAIDPPGTPPVPVFLANSTLPSTEVVPRPGGYLQALTPYEVIYFAEDEHGEDLALDGYLTSVTISGGGRVLRVEEPMRAETTYSTAPNASLGVSPHSPTPLPDPGARVLPHVAARKLYILLFRLHSNVGCSRFNTPPGCQITISLNRQESPHKVSASIHTPVRVPATTLRVVTSVHPLGGVRGDMASGVPVAVYPGTLASDGSWYPDEYHHGDIFALFLGLGSVDGLATRDRTQIFDTAPGGTVALHSCGPLGDPPAWGAQWSLRVTKPCKACRFTFHSTWGAGPFYGSTGGQVPTTVTYTELEASFYDDTTGMGCKAAPLRWRAGETVSEPLDLNVTALGAGGSTTGWQRWWVFATVESGNHTFSSGSSLAARRMRGGVVNITSRLSGPRGGGAEVVLRVQAYAPQYSTDTPGSTEVAERKRYTCNITVPVIPVESPISIVSTPPRVVDIKGATRMCPECNEWEVPVNTLSIEMEVEWDDEALVVMAPTRVPWECNTTTQECHTTGTILAKHGSVSAVNDVGESSGEVTHGNLSKVAFRLKGDRLTATFTPVGSIAGNPVISLLSEGTLQLCVGSSRGPCTTVVLWVTLGPFASALPDPELVLFGTSGLSSPLLPGFPGCGADPTTVTIQAAVVVPWFGARVVDYFTLATFTVSFGGLQLWDTLRTAPYAVGTTVVRRAPQAIPAKGARWVTFAFGGVEPSPQSRQFTVMATVARSRGFVQLLGTTGGTYHFAFPPETPYTALSIADPVTEDDECPTRRLLAATEENYLVHRPIPAKGWGSTTGGAVGIPFPVQVMVLSKQSKRAWSFPRALVLFTKHSWEGCNDGGDLQVMQLRQSEVTDASGLLLDGSISASFVRVDDGDGQGVAVMSNGALTLWPVLSRPCQACRFEATVCYTSARFASECLTAPADLDGPIRQLRSVVTKPFSVTSPAPDTVAVTSQDLPQNTTIHPGTGPLVVHWGAFQTFASWSVPVPAGSPVTVWAYSVWKSDGSQKYGNGGFLAPGAVAPCSVVSDNTTRWGVSSTARDKGSLSFYFVRPCSSCQVWLHATLGSDFPLRVGGAPVTYQVKACSVKWAIASPRSAYRAKPFTLAAIRVDGLGNVVYDAPTDINVVPQPSGANGGGGEVSLSARVAHQGCVSMRIEYPRACYQCSLAIGGQLHTLAVLSHATKLVAIPDGNLSKPYASNGVTFRLNVYAADDLSDRSYLVGGATPLEWAPLYHQVVHPGAVLTMLPHNVSQFHAKVLGNASLLLVTEGEARGEVVEGKRMWNGVPVTPPVNVLSGWGVGTVALRVYDSPSLAIPVRFAVGGVAMQTVTPGRATPPSLAVTVPAEGFVVHKSELALRRNYDYLVQLIPVAPVPRSTNPQLRVIAEVVEPVNVSVVWDCSSCHGTGGAPCVIHSPPWVLLRGSEEMAVRAFDGSGSCTASLIPSNRWGPQALTVHLEGLDTIKWLWTTTPFFHLRGEATGFALAGRRVSVALWAYANDFFRPEHFAPTVVDWGAEALANVTVTATPAGCFQHTSTNLTIVPSPPSEASVLTVSGVFTSGATACRLGVGGLPSSTTPPPLLTAEVAPSATIQHVPFVDTTGVESNFSGLSATTLDGEAAATTESPAVVTFESVDQHGAMVLGDHTTTFQVTGFRIGDQAVVPVNATSTRMTGGVAEVKLWFNETTRVNGSKVHRPWYVYFEAYNQEEVIASFGPMGPLHVVLHGTRLRLRVLQHGGRNWMDSDPPPPLLRGYPFWWRITVADAHGSVPTESGEEEGANLELMLRPHSIPCKHVDTDRAFIGSGCHAGGLCAPSAVPACTATDDDWNVGGKGAMGYQIDLANGTAVLPRAVYQGHTNGVVTFQLTSPILGDPSFRFYLQRITEMRWGGTPCLAYGVKSHLCPVPLEPPFSNATAERLANDPLSSILHLPRLAPRTGFDITVSMMDGAGEPVRGESLLYVVLRWGCHDPRVPPNGMYMGVMGGLDGRQVSDRPGWNRVRVEGGKAVFRGVGAHGWCANASLVFSCESPEEFDTLSDCNGLVMVSAPFEVGSTAVPPSEAPVPSLPPVVQPTAQISLGVVEITTFPVANFETALSASTGSTATLDWLCYTADPAAGATPKLKSNPSMCKRFSRASVLSVPHCGVSQCTTVAEVTLAIPDPSDDVAVETVFTRLDQAVADPESEVRRVLPNTTMGVVARYTAPPPPTPAPTRPPPTPLPPFTYPPPPPVPAALIEIEGGCRLAAGVAVLGVVILLL